MKAKLWQVVAAVTLLITNVSASIHQKDCSIWPNREIIYCFENFSKKEEDDYSKLFKKAIKLWQRQGEDLPITFRDWGNCPTEEEQRNSAVISYEQRKETFLFITLTDEYHFNTSIGNSKISNYLKIGRNYKYPSTFGVVTDNDYAGVLAHELGHVMCLLNENQRMDLKSQLIWKPENLIDYKRAKKNDKASIAAACSDIDAASRLGVYGPLEYAPFKNDQEYTFSEEADWTSIMFLNGQPLSSGSRVIQKADGKDIKTVNWKNGPSDGDIQAVKRLWNTQPARPAQPDPPPYSGGDKEPLPPYCR